jgi:type I restriction enzyme S subunit
VRTENINKNRLGSLTDVARVALPDSVEGKRTLIKRDDLLITITGANVGKCAHVDFDIPEAYVSQSVALVRFLDQTISEFIQKQLIAPSNSGDKTLLQQSAYGIGRPVLNLSNVRDIPILLPPLPEQKRIAVKLDTLLARIDACRDRLDKVPNIIKQFRKSVLAAATSGKLTEDWRDELSVNNLFSEGNQIRLGSVCKLVNGFAYSSKDYVKKGIPLVRISDIDGKMAQPSADIFVPEEMYDEKFLVRSGDILVAMSGATTGKVGRYESILPALQNQRVGNLKISKPEKIIDGYRDLILMASSEMILASAYGGAQPNISSKDIENFEMFLPTNEEQTEIVRRVEKLFALADRLEARVKTARAKVDSLTPSTLAKAFRGELVPQDPNDEPASVLLERIREVKESVLPKRIKGKAPNS